ncbi:hypothetical protein NL529_30475, partial [Klebsiella pneumoniae]|nr:hypothetical protein [Klebsiella pneumoniae]
MSTLSRRSFLGAAASGGALAIGASLAASAAAPAKAASGKLQSLTTDAKPISTAERNARLAKLQGLLREQKAAAFLVEAGS